LKQFPEKKTHIIKLLITITIMKRERKREREKERERELSFRLLELLFDINHIFVFKSHTHLYNNATSSF
jgi:hypothetical protein